MKKRNRLWRVVIIVGAALLNEACSTRRVDMDGLMPIVNTDATADAAEDVVVVLNEQVQELQADETRIYWLGQPGNLSCGQGGERAALRSCRIADCAATLVTYAEGSALCLPGPFEDTAGRPSGRTGWFAIDSENIYWGQPLTSCPLGGCDARSKPANSVPATAEPVLAEKLYWLNSSDPFGLQRCVPERCDATVETVAEFDDPGVVTVGSLTLDSTHAYWTSGGEIRRVALDGSTPTEHIVTTSIQPEALTVAENCIYWVNRSFPGSIVRCPTSGCVDERSPEVLASATYPTWTAVIGSSLFWNHTNEIGYEIELRHCTLDNCSGSAESLEPAAQRILGHCHHGDTLYYGTSAYDGTTTVIHRKRF